MIKNSKKLNVTIFGLGYVGLPLFLEMSKKFRTIGFDKNKKKIFELKKNIDSTGELSKSQIKNLKKLNLTYIFITHDLAVVRNISNKTIVMNKGKIVEMNNTKKVFESPESEYTKELIRSIPTITDAEEKSKP